MRRGRQGLTEDSAQLTETNAGHVTCDSCQLQLCNFLLAVLSSKIAILGCRLEQSDDILRQNITGLT